MKKYIKRYWLFLTVLSFSLLIDAGLGLAQLPSLFPMLVILEIYLAIFLIGAVVIGLESAKFKILGVWLSVFVTFGFFVDLRIEGIKARALEKVSSYIKEGEVSSGDEVFREVKIFTPHRDCTTEGVVPLAEWRRIDFLINCPNSGRWQVSASMWRGEIEKIYVTPR